MFQSDIQKTPYQSGFDQFVGLLLVRMAKREEREGRDVSRCGAHDRSCVSQDEIDEQGLESVWAPRPSC